jgi:hypothetical protein
MSLSGSPCRWLPASPLVAAGLPVASGTLTHESYLIAVGAFPEGVIGSEFLQMPLLVGSQRSGASAQRTSSVKRCEESRPNELRPIRDSAHGLL